MSTKKYAFIFTIVFATIFKNYAKAVSDTNKIKLDKCDSVEMIKISFVKSTIYNTLWAGMNFMTDFIFDQQLTTYGGFVAVKVLKNVFFSNSRIAMDIPGSEFEYYMSEGGKALAKISRYIIFAFLSKSCHFIFNLRCVLDLDVTQGKLATKLFLLSLFLLSLIKIWKIKRIIKFNKAIIDLAYDKEKIITENIDNIAIIKSYRAENHSIVKYMRKSFLWEHANMSFKFWNLSTDMIYNLFSCISRPGSTIYYIYAANRNDNIISNNRPFIFMDMISEMLKTINNIINIFTDLIETVAVTYEVLKYLNICREELDKKVRVKEFKRSIQIQNLNYSTKDKHIFSGVNFSINKGDKIALFGKNGAGKSSIFKLILGFDDFRGSILFDDIDLQKLSLQDYRKLITYVPQDTKLFDETIFFNLTFGNSKSYIEVVEECKRMQIHDTIMAFPNGYNTCVGENGKNINGGLRQKIFYTRAFLCDSEIYMFDEPTNNLDINHSRFLLDYINDEKFYNKTFFVICHDLDIVKKFPTILHFDDGKIKEVDNL